MVSSHDNNHFISRLACLADILQQLNKLIWNYKEGEGQSSISMTSQRIREKTWKLEAKSSSRKFCLFENIATEAGDEVNVDLASKVVQHLGGLRKEFVL